MYRRVRINTHCHGDDSSLDQRGHQLLNRMEPQSVGSIFEVAGVERDEWMVEYIGESGLARQAFDVGLAVKAEEALPCRIDRWACLLGTFPWRRGQSRRAAGCNSS